MKLMQKRYGGTLMSNDMSNHILEQIRDAIMELREDVRELRVRTESIADLERRMREVEHETTKTRVYFTLAAFVISTLVSIAMRKL